ncbi:hypothetical protein [Kocuria atrinae]|uniref:hypothetical protein n=1 Tax=Kocuria atrinae TaxID=592377 RepID=UPI001CB8F6FD|nr:hypothetical protein [Kocuria atrinae]
MSAISAHRPPENDVPAWWRTTKYTAYPPATATVGQDMPPARQTSWITPIVAKAAPTIFHQDIGSL